MTEEWRWIPKYEFRYEISNLGKVRGMNEGDITPTIDGNGFAKVCLRKNGQSTFIPVYYLLAITFIPNPEKHRFVKMKDGNKSNLSLDNLEWFTPQQGPKPAPPQKNAIPDAFKRSVKCLDTGKEYLNIMVAAKATGIPPMFIKWICDNNKPLPDILFEYADDQLEPPELEI